MPRPALLVALIVFAATDFAAIHTAFAQGQTVHRCIGEHGEISFSDAPCTGAAAPALATSSVATTLSGDRTGVASTCPASEDALRNVVAAAFAQRNPNTLAGVMRWDGVGGAAARSRMRELAELTQRPLIGIDLDLGDAVSDPNTARDRDADIDANPPGEDATSPRRVDSMLTIHTGSLEGGAGEHEFRLVPSGGCYWLDW